MIKSGADFRDLSLIEMRLDKENNTKKVTKIEHYLIESSIPEEPIMKEIVNKYLGILFIAKLIKSIIRDFYFKLT